MKFKAKVKNNQLIVKVTIASSDTVSERELEALNVNLMRGFLKPRRSRKNVFEYTGPSGISLESYLKRNISEYEFLNIMTQITDMTLKVESYNLQLKNIVLDLRYVYINENTKEYYIIALY